MADLQDSLRPHQSATPEDLHSLLANLDTLLTWPHGRVVREPMGILKPNDTLVPSFLLPYISDLKSVRLPITVWFLRRSRSTNIAGVTLLWNVPGIHQDGVEHFRLEFIIGDLLHTLDLGVLPKFAGLVL